MGPRHLVQAKLEYSLKLHLVLYYIRCFYRCRKWNVSRFRGFVCCISKMKTFGWTSKTNFFLSAEQILLIYQVATTNVGAPKSTKYPRPILVYFLILAAQMSVPTALLGFLHLPTVVQIPSEIWNGLSRRDASATCPTEKCVASLCSIQCDALWLCFLIPWRRLYHWGLVPCHCY